jgi:hypothetical protein
VTGRTYGVPDPDQWSRWEKGTRREMQLVKMMRRLSRTMAPTITPIYVNPDSVSSVFLNGDGETTVCFTGDAGDYIHVTETVDEVVELLTQGPGR